MECTTTPKVKVKLTIAYSKQVASFGPKWYSSGPHLIIALSFNGVQYLGQKNLTTYPIVIQNLKENAEGAKA